MIKSSQLRLRHTVFIYWTVPVTKFLYRWGFWLHAGIIFGSAHPVRLFYLGGSRLDGNLFTYILDAICYGGLYQKYKIDVENEKNGGSYEMRNLWSNDLMLNVFRVLTETVGVHGFNNTSLLINQSALVIAVLAILFSLLFFR